jgi:hypothetical protein
MVLYFLIRVFFSELLILDEPTVGVDPLLRQCIWNHLLQVLTIFGIHLTFFSFVNILY